METQSSHLIGSIRIKTHFIVMVVRTYDFDFTYFMSGTE